jgi:hypothetical protein
MAESVFLECNAIHVPVQCKPNTGFGASFKLQRFDLVRHGYFVHSFGLFSLRIVYFGACLGLCLGLTIVLKSLLIPFVAYEYWHKTC